MNQGQRIVVVIGLGVALGTLGEWVTNANNGAFGWVGYAPLSRATFVPDSGLEPWARLLIWLVLTVLWTAFSVWLLRSRRQPGGQ